MLWIHGQNFKGKFIVATTIEAAKHASICFAGTIVVTWEAWLALGNGLAEVQGPERHARLLQALNYFADQQGYKRLEPSDELTA